MNMQLHSIAVLDDHQLIIEGVQKLVTANSQWHFAGGFHNAAMLQNYITTNGCPHVLLLDIHLPEEDGIVLCKELLKQYPQLLIVMLTSISETAVVKNAMKNGAKGFMLKNMQATDLWDCLEKVMAGETYLHKDIEKTMIQAGIGVKAASTNYIPKLSRREKEILDLIAKEMTTQEIATQLFISVNTVETHRASLLSKFGCRNIAGLIKAAMEKGLID
jgi:DNA-binding NarL/FixJ family response regulator